MSEEDSPFINLFDVMINKDGDVGTPCICFGANDSAFNLTMEEVQQIKKIIHNHRDPNPEGPAIELDVEWEDVLEKMEQWLNE